MTATLTTFEDKDSIGDIAAKLRQDGAVIIQRLAPEQLMDDVYAEIEDNVAPADFESNTYLWPESNKTIGGEHATWLSDGAQVLSWGGHLELSKKSQLRSLRAEYVLPFKAQC